MNCAGIDVTQDTSGFAIQLDQPAGSSIRSAGDAGQPDCVFVELQSKGLAILIPLAEILACQIKTLDSSILPIRDVDDTVLVDLNRVRQFELPRTRTSAAPFADFLSFGRVLEDPGVPIAVGDK